MEKYQAINNFIKLAVKNGVIEEPDKIYFRNRLLHFLGLHDWNEPEVKAETTDSLALMDELLEVARENSMFDEMDAEFYEAALMDFITPRPSVINQRFWQKYENNSEKATNYFYDLAHEVNQVKTRDIAKNITFEHPSRYGNLEITINLSKPEKDPKTIATAKSIKTPRYPECALCMENEGFYGEGNRVARSNHRIVRLELNGEEWGFHYSPYAYYNEHSIVISEKHHPMKINRRTFRNLLAFLDKFPHYMIGSNADLPIVGGSILTHDHYQAGRHEFPMAKAEIREKIKFPAFPEIRAAIVDWPMSVLRLSGENKDDLLECSDLILRKWREYDDEKLDIVSKTKETDAALKNKVLSADSTFIVNRIEHHTITPIARKRGSFYEMDLVLRDNNVNKIYPDGIFHPHAELHHIKKENIGLIEVMGLAILPPRLKDELKEVEKYLLNKPNEMNEIHKDWADELKNIQDFTAENVEEKLRREVGEVFAKVLQDAGVFKDDRPGHDGFMRFINFVNKSALP